LIRRLPSLELVRLVSGTEATMTALLPRAASPGGRRHKPKVLSRPRDSLLVKAGSGALTFGQPSSVGSSAIANETIAVVQRIDCRAGDVRGRS
jgi:glutamate-1-semialdehyde 2,1-aminomutase